MGLLNVDYPEVTTGGIKVSGGNSSAVIWVLIFIILILTAIILIRDKGIREKIRSFFRFVGKKFKISRLDSNIEKLQNGIKELIVDLGKKTWELGLLKEKGEKIYLLIDECTKTKKDLSGKIKEIDGKLVEEHKSHDNFMMIKKSEIRAIEGKRRPFDAQLKNNSDKLSMLKKSKKECEKNIGKLKKGIEKNRKELKKLKDDKFLDDEERESRKKKSREALDAFIPDLSKKEEELIVIKSDIDKISLKINKIEKDIGKYNLMIEQIKDEIKDAEKRNDKIVKEMVKEKGRIAASISLESGKLGNNFFLMGDLADKLRPDNSSLRDIINKIDKKRRTVENLKKEKNSLNSN